MGNLSVILNDNIVRYRKHLQMRQIDLAEKAGMNAASISRIESDPSADPTLSSLEKIATALSTTVIALLTPSPKIEKMLDADPKPKFNTFSQWIWTEFNDVVLKFCKEDELVDEKVLRRKFEAFVQAVVDPKKIVPGYIDSLWNDRTML